MRTIPLILFCTLMVNCSPSEQAFEDEYIALKVTARTLIADEELLVATSKYIALVESGQEEPVIDQRVLRLQYPIWIERHNDLVDSYNKRSKTFDWHLIGDRSVIDMPRRFWKLDVYGSPITFGEAEESYFSK